MHCEECDKCKYNNTPNCRGVSCIKFRYWFNIEWRRVTSELKTHFKKKGE